MGRNPFEGTFSLLPTLADSGLWYQGGALWARIAQNVKKPPLTVNVTDFEFFGFNVFIWVPQSPIGPKKS